MWKIVLIMVAIVSPNGPPKHLADGVVRNGFATEAVCEKNLAKKSFAKMTQDMVEGISKKLNGTKVIITARCVDTSKKVEPKIEPQGESI
jgi:hypothetical protein